MTSLVPLIHYSPSHCSRYNKWHFTLTLVCLCLGQLCQINEWRIELMFGWPLLVEVTRALNVVNLISGSSVINWLYQDGNDGFQTWGPVFGPCVSPQCAHQTPMTPDVDHIAPNHPWDFFSFSLTSFYLVVHLMFTHKMVHLLFLLTFTCLTVWLLLWHTHRMRLSYCTHLELKLFRHLFYGSMLRWIMNGAVVQKTPKTLLSACSHQWWHHR